MNNNQMNFDPMTGQPINQNNTNFATGIPTNTIKQNSIQTQTSNVNVVQQPQITTFNSQQMIQNIPTVEQTKQEFINNIQENNVIKKEEKKDGPNIVFILILFIIIFAAIFFLFPYLQKTL